MILKDIYMWIEDYFFYFKYIVKLGWKNFICYNFFLYDMFVWEMFVNGKVFFWIIYFSVNCYLILDQVFKLLDLGFL